MKTYKVHITDFDNLAHFKQFCYTAFGTCKCESAWNALNFWGRATLTIAENREVIAS